MRGPGAAAAMGHLDNPREYSGGGGKRGGALTRGWKELSGWTDSKEGDIVEVQRKECPVLVDPARVGMNEDWAEGSLREQFLGLGHCWGQAGIKRAQARVIYGVVQGREAGCLRLKAPGHPR